MLLGGGANRAAAEARQLVEALDAPTACTINAKGILPKGHPLSLGSNTSLRPVRELLLASDAVLAVGTEMGETDYDLVFDGNLRIKCPLIRIDIDPEQVNSNFPADVAIVSDSKLAIESLLMQIDGRESASPDSPGAKLTAEVRTLLDAAWPAAWQGQRRTLETLQDALPDLIIVGDSTQPVYSGNHLFEPSTPRSWFNSATGYGTLGYGLPAAVGAKLAAPGRPVVALIGDGGLQFTLPELASAIEARAPVIVLLWNNEGYGEIKRYMQERGIPTIGVDIYTPDLLAIARGFGCGAERATSFGQLRELLQRAALRGSTHGDRGPRGCAVPGARPMSATEAEWIALESNGLAAAVDPLGAQLSLLRDSKGQDLLWSGDPAIWKGRAPLLFPIVGALAGGRYRVGSNTYRLPRHGFARDRRFEVVRSTRAVAEFELTADQAKSSDVSVPLRLECPIRARRHHSRPENTHSQCRRSADACELRLPSGPPLAAAVRAGALAPCHRVRPRRAGADAASRRRGVVDAGAARHADLESAPGA